MQTYLILLRGINVGGKNMLPMPALTDLLKHNGYQHIKTYLQTGNIIVQNGSRPVAAEVAAAIENQFGFLPQTLIISKAELQTAIDENPYTDAKGNQMHFYFCMEAPQLDAERTDRLKAPNEHYQLHDRVFYLHAPDGIGRSKLVADIDRCLGVSATGRNLNTVTKLSELLN